MWSSRLHPSCASSLRAICTFPHWCCCCRADSDSQITEQYAALQALLLAASSTRAAATQHVIKHLLQTSQHLLTKPTSSHTDPVSNGAKVSDAKANGGTGEGGGNRDKEHSRDRAGGGTHDQLVTIQSGLAALHEAVAAHEDAAVCLMVWQQLVHLAAPTGLSKHKCLHNSLIHVANAIVPLVLLPRFAYCESSLHVLHSRHR